MCQCAVFLNDMEPSASTRIIDCTAFFYEEGKGGENYRKKNKFRCLVDVDEKRLAKLKESVW